MPGLCLVPEQWVVNREVLGAVIEFVLACAKAANPTAGKHTLLEQGEIADKALERGTAGKSRHTGAYDGN